MRDVEEHALHLSLTIYGVAPSQHNPDVRSLAVGQHLLLTVAHLLLVGQQCVPSRTGFPPSQHVWLSVVSLLVGQHLLLTVAHLLLVGQQCSSELYSVDLQHVLLARVCSGVQHVQVSGIKDLGVEHVVVQTLQIPLVTFDPIGQHPSGSSGAPFILIRFRPLHSLHIPPSVGVVGKGIKKGLLLGQAQLHVAGSVTIIPLVKQVQEPGSGVMQEVASLQPQGCGLAQAVGRIISSGLRGTICAWLERRQEDQSSKHSSIFVFICT